MLTPGNKIFTPPQVLKVGNRETSAKQYTSVLVVRGGAVLRLLWQLLWNVVALFRTSQPRPPSFLFKQSRHQTVLNCNVQKPSIGFPVITSRKCGAETRRVRSHCSWPRLYISLWLDLGGSGEVTFIANNKSAVVFTQKHKLRIHLITSGSQDEETDPVRSAFPRMHWKRTLAAENVSHSEETRVSRQSVDKLRFTRGALNCISGKRL